MSFTTASAPRQVVSANSFKKSFKAGPSLVRQATSKKLETGKVFRPGHANAQAERQPSLSNRREEPAKPLPLQTSASRASPTAESLLGFKVTPSLRKIAAEAVAAQDSHNYRVGAFSFKTNCRKSLSVAEAMRPPGTPPQLEGEGRVKKAGGGELLVVAADIMRRVQADNRRASDPCGDSEAARQRRIQALWDKATAEAVLDQRRREHYRPGVVRRMRTYLADMHFQSLNMLAGGTSGF